MELTTAHWIVLGGYVIGAALLLWGGNGLVKELNGRARRVREATNETFQLAIADIESLQQSFAINSEAQAAAGASFEASAAQATDAVQAGREAVRRLEIAFEELRLQNLRGDETVAQMQAARQKAELALHGPSFASPTERDVLAAGELGTRLRTATKEKWITAAGLALTTAASCLSVFLP